MNRCRTSVRTLVFLAAAVLLASCNTVSKVAYFRDVEPYVPIGLQEAQQLRIRQGDRLQITVFSRDHELANLFNQSEGMSGDSHPYTVDNNGEIDIPVLGRFQVSGLTRLELADQIKYRLLAGELIVDPTVQVEYADMAFYALGEINRPGRIAIPKDELTVLEAVALAGDLTINGRRDNVLVLRTENGVQTPYLVDLTSKKSIYNSPVFYMQQNDMIYVEPSVKRANQSTIYENNLLTPGFWVSLVSMASTLYLLISRIASNN